MRTTLFILENPFEDEKISDEDFLCSQCILMEGLNAKFPNQLEELIVERIAFSRPRQKVVELVGDENQSLPTLVLGNSDLLGQETGEFNGTRFVKGQEHILNALTSLYNIPRVHP